jgi:hypothetical protein
LVIEEGITVAAEVASLEIITPVSLFLAILVPGADGIGSADCLFCGKWNALSTSISVPAGGVTLTSRAELLPLLSMSTLLLDGHFRRPLFNFNVFWNLFHFLI